MASKKRNKKAAAKKASIESKAVEKPDTRARIIERDGAGRIKRVWLHDIFDRGSAIVKAPTPAAGPASIEIISKLRQILSDAFLPVGYPESVTPDYIGYQTFDSLQAFFSTITSLLSNRAILQGLGVGDADSSATYAVLLTIFKDGISRIATIGFAYRFGTVIEPEAKSYRFLADIFNDSAFFLDLLAPLLRGHESAQVALLVVAEALRAVCGVAAGASKAALSSHFALRNNLSELNAKESSQETAVGLFGLLVGSVVVRYVEGREAVFGLMIVLVLAHLAMNYLAVRCVQLKTFNKQRATIVYEHFLETGEILTYAAVAEREKIFGWKPVATAADGRKLARIEFARSYADAMRGPNVICVTRRHVRGVYMNDDSFFMLCLHRRGNALPVIKILLIGDPAQLDIAYGLTAEAWAAAIELAHNTDLASLSEIPEASRYEEDLQDLWPPADLPGLPSPTTEWSMVVNLEPSAPWVTIDGERKDL
ncbi:duf647 domain-containing protein [Colletotrichum sojae]|uniref:Duf647 domain-containing protein n=1 Tax=Colletotrichum sojae TaxID=2175907 RepID=A0A8H6N013_9PEZI|nr:duf647 domain-containing protein [Colletotrichum sojae]